LWDENHTENIEKGDDTDIKCSDLDLIRSENVYLKNRMEKKKKKNMS
jgi:hypothetical protein